MVRAVTPNLDSIDVEEVRRSFANIDDMVYLNTGTEGLAPRPVLDKLIELTTYCETKGQASIEVSRALIETARERVAQFLGVESSTIGFAENATEAVNWVASSLDFNPGDEVLLSLNEHPAMNFPWTYQRNLGRDIAQLVRDQQRPRRNAGEHPQRNHRPHQADRAESRRAPSGPPSSGQAGLRTGGGRGSSGAAGRRAGAGTVSGRSRLSQMWTSTLETATSGCAAQGVRGFSTRRSERLPLLTQRHVGVGSTETPFRLGQGRRPRA